MKMKDFNVEDEEGYNPDAAEMDICWNCLKITMLALSSFKEILFALNH